MRLCVSCKACRRECPTGVDMARMKLEVMAARLAKRGLSLHDRLVGSLPRYAPVAARWPWLFNLRDDIGLIARLSETHAGFAARRKLPRWRGDWFRDPVSIPSQPPAGPRPDQQGEVVLFVDTFNRYFELGHGAKVRRRRDRFGSAHLLKLSQRADRFRAGLVREQTRPQCPADFADIDVAARVDGHAVRAEKLGRP